MRRSAALAIMVVLAGLIGSRAAGAHPSCGTVEVVYANGRPVVGAQVTHRRVDPSTNKSPADGESWETGRDGRVCARRLLTPGFIEVDAPLALGGWCAAMEQQRYRPAAPSADNPDGVTRVRLHMRWLRRAWWTGRVVGPGDHPVEGAKVTVEHVWPDGTACSEDPQLHWYTTSAKGIFHLERLPEGGVDLRVEADGYAVQVFRVTVPGPARDLSIDAGAEWSGRLLDPEGASIELCWMRLHTHDLLNIETACTPTGFSFRNVEAGDAKLYVRVGKGSSFGDERSLMIPVHIAPGERRHEDIRWPVGLDVSGTVVDDAGVPVPGAYLRTASQDRDRVAAEGTIDTMADERGRFTFRHLAPGPWTVMAGRDILCGTDVTVVAGSKDVRIVLPARGRRQGPP